MTVVPVLGWFGHAWADIPPQVAQDNRRCLNCHGQAHIRELDPHQRQSMVAPPADPDAPAIEPSHARPELYVEIPMFDARVHQSVSCVQCHTDATALPHAARLQPVTCTGGCHENAVMKFHEGNHAIAQAEGRSDAPSCVTCHGGHDIKPSNDFNSRTHRLNQTRLCGECHQQHTTKTENGQDAKSHIDDYLASVHGKAVHGGGLIVAATCSDCHRSHDVLPAENPLSSVHRNHVAETCGQCHVGVEQTFINSVHGTMLAAGNEKAPVCTSCHTAHAITRASTPAFQADIVNECGECHNEPRGGTADGMQNATGRSFYETYRMSYHGQVTELGSDRAARCSDCHGAHDVLPIDDPASRMHMDNRVEFCSSCHPRANDNFVQYLAHADHRDGVNYPILHYVWLYFVIVMSITFGLFGLHCAAWFIRSAVDKWRFGPQPRTEYTTHGIKRFSTLNRINHALIVITFFGLTLTGMPILFSDQGWARAMMGAVGGVHAAGVLHRVFAVMLLGNFAAHFVGLFQRWRQTSFKHMMSGPASMMPRWKDVTDVIGMIKWFCGAKHKPKFDHWTYWEKFDYWAEIFGSVVIGGTGLILWFPEFFSRWMPGWWFNVATIIHGYEALLAVCFIFTIHFFNAHLRYEKFPVDDVIFSGTLPEEEFKHEREAEYERLVASGQIEHLRTAAPPAWVRKVAVIVGIVAMLIGMGLVVHIVLAGAGMI